MATVESETLEAFLPDLVTAICDDVQRITDQCLSSGLISDSRRRRIFEARSSEDQARALIQCVQNSTKTDNRCLEIFLDSLDKELPRLVKEKLLPDMRKNLSERTAISKAVVPAAVFQKHQEDDRLQCLQQQSSLFGRYENSMKKYAHASAEKGLCEQSLQLKMEESGRIRSNLEIMKSQSPGSEVEAKEIEGTKDRLSACEIEMAELKERIEKLEGIIQEEDMQARRGKSIIMVGTKVLAKMTEEQFAVTLMERENEYMRLLKEQEDELRQKMQDEMNTKIRDLEHKVALQERDHKVALQEKELKIIALERDKAKISHRKEGFGPAKFQSGPPKKRHRLGLATTYHSTDSPSVTDSSLASCLDTQLDLCDHFQATVYLQRLDSAGIFQVGGALGLSYDKLCKMTSYPDEMVAAWLRREDLVMNVSGEPTWRTLIQALRKVGQKGLARDIEEAESR